MQFYEKKYKQEIFENDLNLTNNESTIITDNLNEPIILPNDPPANVPTNENTEGKTNEAVEDNSQNEPKKRGRKKGSTKEVLQAKKQAPVQSAKPKQDIDLSQYGQIETPQSTTTEIEAPAQQVDISKYISGALLLMMIDFLLPVLFTFVYPKLKRLKDKKKLKMTKDERKELEPIADECIKQVAMKLAPMEAMGLMLLFVYGGKIYELEESDYKPEIIK
jgi:hypothetical protein